MSDEKIVSLSTRLYPTQWFAMPALALETPALRVITVPSVGAKIVSIFDRAAGREWLLPPGAPQRWSLDLTLGSGILR